MEHTWDILFPVFGYQFNIVYTDNITESRKKYNGVVGRPKRAFLPDSVDGLHSYHKEEPDSYIFFTPETTDGVIAHEVYHAIRQMLKYIGAKQDNEVVAYHLSYTIDKINRIKNSIDNAKREHGTTS